MMVGLGKFGDSRLQKGGPSCWKGWFMSARAGRAFAPWAGTVPGSFVLGGS
jgi:hypothetical protein